jgi:membrane-bound ClpP family serine protease
MNWLSNLIDKASDYFARRKGLLPLLGIALVIVNFILPLLVQPNFFTLSNFFLHLGVIVAIFGIMLGRAL